MRFKLFKRIVFMSFVSALLLTLIRIQITVQVIAFPELPILGFFTDDITIDGVFEDWTDVMNYIDDPANDTLDPYNETLAISDIIRVKMANNLTHIFWKVDLSGQLSPQGVLPYWSIQLYSEDVAHYYPSTQTLFYPGLSLDFNASFLVSKWSDGGYVRRIWDPSITWGSGNIDYDWGAIPGNTTWYAWSGNSIELTFPMSDLSSGIPITNGTHIKMQIVSAFCQTWPDWKSEDKSVHFIYVIRPGTIFVPDDYSTIQSAINAANPGDTIFVRAGIYYEYLTIDKSLSLIGENRETTIIDGNGSMHVIDIRANYVCIKGFTIQNGWEWGIKIDPGGTLYYYHNVTISENKILGGIDLYQYATFTYHNVSMNIVSGTILVWCSGNSIVRNIVYGGIHGIINLGSNLVIGNVVTSRDYGIVHGSNSVVNQNNVTNCIYGILVESSNNVTDNFVGNNAWGIQAQDNNTIVGNTIKSNYGGIILGNNNAVYHNSFINNIEQRAYSEETINTWDNGYPSGGNYWSDYNGTDLDGEGIGDTPYIIDENNIDHYPLMNPWGSLQFNYPETISVYQVHLDVYKNFSTGYYLLTEFYSYNDIYQGSLTVWYGTTPADIVLSMDITHPQDKPIEKIYLVLRDINLNKIQTIISFTMTRTDLFKRLVYLDGEWPYVSPDERSAMMNEIVDIDIGWIYALS